MKFDENMVHRKYRHYTDLILVHKIMYIKMMMSLLVASFYSFINYIILLIGIFRNYASTTHKSESEKEESCHDTKDKNVH